MWEYLVILFLCIIDMVKAQTTAFTMYAADAIPKSDLYTAVTIWCQTSGTPDQRNAQFTTSGGCSRCSGCSGCFGPIAGK